MVAALVRDCIEGVDEQTLVVELDARTSKDNDPWKSLLDDPEAVEGLEASLENDDFQEIKKSAEERHARKMAAASGSSEKSGKALAATDGGAGQQLATATGASTTWKLRPLPAGDEDIDIATARQWLLERRGVSLNKGVKRCSRWSASFPRPMPPTHCTKSWGPNSGHTVGSALSVVLRQIWSWHSEETGQPCPYEFATL